MEPRSASFRSSRHAEMHRMATGSRRCDGLAADMCPEAGKFQTALSNRTLANVCLVVYPSLG